METVAAVGEALISTIFEGLLDKFTATSDLTNFAKNKKLDLELKKWHRILQSIKAVLADAEEKQVTNKTVRIWLTELRESAYEVEDVWDNLAYEAWKRKSKAQQQPRTKFEKLFIFPSGLKPNAVMFGVEMESKLKKITRRLQEIAKQKNELQLKEGELISMAYYKDQRPPTTTTSLVNQVNVFGREKDKEAILKLLLLVVDQKSSDEFDQVPLALIPITGMGGIGKTTLAQLVYNDDRVQNFFDLKAWIPVSQDFDVIKVTKAILQAIDSTSVTTCNHINDLDLLHLKLKEEISGKKLLLVLDDVWHENSDGWELLLRPFEVGNSSVCKIIVTTRNQNVSQITGNLLPAAYPLKELADDDCLSILACHVFGSKNFDAQPNLKEFGREIVKKCKGLPLAVKASAGLLRTKLLDKEHWEAVCRSKIWDLSEIMQRGVFPALRLSYHHLPSHLKPCFAYCSLLPKGYEFDREELVLLWMAEGFLQHKGNMQPQELGRRYFSDLLSRSFFRQSKKSHSLFVMHDLLIDLAQSVAGDMCLNMEHELQIDEHNLENARHVSFIRRQYDVSGRFQVFNKMKNVRSLIALPMSYQENHCYLSCKVLDQLLPKLKRLRVLSLSGYLFEDLSDTIGDLNHLRYLNLSKTGIRSLPKSIGKLHHLRILILAHCRNLIALPVEICRLIQLQHLDIRDTPKLQEMPPGLGKLTSLRVLPKFVIGKAGGLTLRDLKDLPLLHGQLCICISRLHNVVDIVRDARDANLKQNSNLRELALEWSNTPKLTSNSCSDLEVLESLRPSKDLQRLSISCYGATMFPPWVRNPYLAKIVQIDLFDCIHCASLPSLGQLPLLRILNVKGMNAVTSLGPEFYGDGSPFLKKAFPSLELLRFEKMKKWEEWNSCVGNVQVFPLLRELILQDCQILAAKLPGILPSLVKLDVKRCPQLIHSPLSFPSLGELNVEDNNDLILTSMVEQSSIITKLIMKGISGLTCLTEKLTKALAKLEVLEIEGCKELTCLWPKRSELENMPCLKNLVIKSCPKLVSLVGEKEGLSCLSALKLKCLTIHDCMAMESLPDTFEMNDLEELEIFGCPSLIFFLEGKLPFTLKRLSIRNCRNIQCLLDGNKSHLEYLCIDDRLALESFLESGFQIPNLQIFHIFNINSLPNQMQKLTSLGELSLSNCEALESIPSSGLPPNITLLELCNCKNLKQPMLEWGLSKLNCLKELKITGACPAADMVSFPDDEGEMLPSTLTTLFMENMKNLESLSRGLRNLRDLEQLCMKDCPKLRTLPMTAMPVSLGRLYIFGCPLLQERCKKNRGEYWPIISHIPCLEID